MTASGCLCSADCLCGSCRGFRESTPVLVDNRPGLSSVQYRVGDHARFKASLLTALSRARHPALRDLTTRADDDFSIALLDAFAVMADIFTFYQERIANESFLRTAGERLSVGYLAKLIGYELRPGSAANVSLAFQMMEAPGLPKGAPGVVRKLTLPIGTRVQSTPAPDEAPQAFETTEEMEVRPAWNAMAAATDQDQVITAHATEALLTGSSLGLRAGDVLLFVFQEDGAADFTAAYRRIKRVEADARADQTRVLLQDPAHEAVSFGGLSEEQAGVFAFRKQASLFGHNAPDFAILKASLGDKLEGDEWQPASVANSESRLFLDAAYRDVVPGSWAVWERATTSGGEMAVLKVTAAAEMGLAAFGLSGKSTAISVEKAADAAAVTLAPAENDFAELRSTIVLVQSEKLALARVPRGYPVPAPVAGTTIELAEPADELPAGRRVAVSGTRVDDEGAGQEGVELAWIASVSADGLQVTLAQPLAWSYDPATVRINANVVAATHGETVRPEVFEGGDARVPFQRFPLKQPPVTYVSAATPSGTSSTLRVFVDEVEWHEVPFLYGQGPDDQVFITRSDGDGRAWIQFGDGVTGARLPTGARNVRAQYRRGLGAAGNLEAGQVNLLMSRPLGLKDASNPLPSADGKDGEMVEDARGNAPLTVLTLDRVVSLQDYEDFARAFAGVAKAAATWTWFGQSRGVFLTVAGAEGGEVSLEGRQTLKDSIAAWGDPYVPVAVENHLPATFLAGIRVKVDPDHQADKVLAAVEVALRDAFSFTRRSFGQDVSWAEVAAVAQAVEGVVAVQVASLHRAGDADLQAGLAAPLAAAAPLPGERGSVQPAELLTLDSAPLSLLEEMA